MTNVKLMNHLKLANNNLIIQNQFDLNSFPNTTIKMKINGKIQLVRIISK